MADLFGQGGEGGNKMPSGDSVTQTGAGSLTRSTAVTATAVTRSTAVTKATSIHDTRQCHLAQCSAIFLYVVKQSPDR